MMKAKLAVVALGVGAVLVFAAPASAQAFSGGSTLTVKVVQTATGDDRVDLYGLDGNDDSGSGALVRNISDDLNIDQTTYEVSEPDEQDNSSPTAPQVEINTHSSLFKANGNTLAFSINAAPLRNTAARFDYSQLQLSVCPLAIRAVNDSSRPADEVDGNCSQWNEATTSNNKSLVVQFVETPTTSAYWNLTVWLMVSALIATLVLALPTFWLRHRKLNTLGTPNLVLAVIATSLAWFSAVFAMAAIYGGATSVDELVLANGYSDAAHVLAAVFPGLLFALPFLVPALMLVMVPPRPVDVSAVPTPVKMGGPGVPSWLGPAIAPSQTVPQQQSWQQESWHQEQAPAAPVDEGAGDKPGGAEPPPTWQAPS